MLDGDELAGIAAQFGALTSDELARAVEELAFRRGETATGTAVDDAIDRATADLQLIAYEDDDGRALLAPGPTALPTLPADADDLPHILDVAERSVTRERLAEPAERRLREAAATAVAAGDRDRIVRLMDATYDLESWAPDVAVASVRERLDAALAEAGTDGSDGADPASTADGDGTDGA